jgi:hypothetical protein
MESPPHNAGAVRPPVTERTFDVKAKILVFLLQSCLPDISVSNAELESEVALTSGPRA